MKFEIEDITEIDNIFKNTQTYLTKRNHFLLSKYINKHKIHENYINVDRRENFYS